MGLALRVMGEELPSLTQRFAHSHPGTHPDDAIATDQSQRVGKVRERAATLRHHLPSEKHSQFSLETSVSHGHLDSWPLPQGRLQGGGRGLKERAERAT